MSDDFKISSSLSKERLPIESVAPKKQIILDVDHKHEVYRNNTTAVEVIVKQIKNKNTIKDEALEVNSLDRLYTEIEKLKVELNEANSNLEATKKCFGVVMLEMGRQLESANQRELRRQTKNLLLQLEKEKLKSILESKTCLVSKMKKELLSMKRIIKILSKCIGFVSSATGKLPSISDYAEFENDLLKRQRCTVTSITDETQCSK